MLTNLSVSLARTNFMHMKLETVINSIQGFNLIIFNRNEYAKMGKNEVLNVNACQS